MKKTIVLFFALFTFYFVNAQQPNTLIDPTKTTVIVLDSSKQTTTFDTAAITEYFTLVNAWFSGCGADVLALFNRGKQLGVNTKDIFKDLPLPTTQEGITAWVDRIDLLVGGIGSVLVPVLTLLLSLFKKDPEGTVSKFQTIFNKIRTRYLLVFSSLVVSGIGAFYFNEGKFSLSTVFSWLGLALGVTVGGIGFKGLLELFGVNLTAKKVKVPA